ncbi:MAG: hypothetical protein KIH69_007935 [Anaerolineae bacterium]|nr:hypothetical protein [Anaerolineae bacterium]
MLSSAGIDPRAGAAHEILLPAKIFNQLFSLNGLSALLKEGNELVAMITASLKTLRAQDPQNLKSKIQNLKQQKYGTTI